MILGVVADDITGAGDLGGMTAGAGHLTHIHAFDAPPFASADALAAADVSILDTDSRLDDPAVAYRKVHAATRALASAGCERFFNKTCSVFRGNIGAEFDAMLDALGEDFAVVVLGFPANGRITREGIHYVHGRRLEDSPFRHDPIHPMTRSNLVEILQAQTERRVGLLNHEVVARGAAALEAQIERERVRVHYLILDVADQEALVTIARAVARHRVLCGSSALAAPLAATWPPPPPRPRPDASPPSPTGVLGALCVAGSLTPQTTAQVEHLATRGVPRLTLDPRRLFDPETREAEIARCSDACSAVLLRGEDALVHAASSPDVIAATKATAAAGGLAGNEAARRVSGALAEITARVRNRVGLSRLVVAGGDTSAAVCRRLGVRALRVHREIRPGLPSCVALTDPPLLLVLKSGSFGDPDFLEEAVHHLEEIVPAGRG